MRAEVDASADDGDALLDKQVALPLPNRIGHEILDGDGIEFWGQSFVAGTSGQILARAPAEKEEILIVEVDISEVDATRTHWPFLRDRRIDAYGDLTKRLVDG